MTARSVWAVAGLLAHRVEERGDITALLVDGYNAGFTVVFADQPDQTFKVTVREVEP